MKPISYRCHRFPPQIIQHAIWLYCRFTLSFRDVEDLLAERGLEVSYETVRRWVLKFGHSYARRLRRFRPRPDDRWHLDEMFVKIRGRQMYLWRAVDAEGEVLDCLVQSKRNKAAALKLMRKLLKKQGYVPSSIVTDKLPSYGAALRSVTLAVDGMTCVSCPYIVKQTLARVPGVGKVTVSFKKKTAGVALTIATTNVGFPSRVIK